ncbi:hypothetical protein B2J93_2871 [Marssonina coronariae]|uniref:Uncharacterized protein n=1 Tax=Diplocarpon coronariae TaxID=2795749 RepID=A0A218YVC2_9HELO|nr:hypothetical protein B2J93_2871 [Marssonina coronariae]
MSSPKGKGRARSETDDTDRESPAFLSRVAASASGLTRNAFAVPKTNELSAQSAAISNSDKGQFVSGIGGSGTAWTESSKSTYTPQQPSMQASSPSGFRTGHGELHARLSETEFSNFLGGIDSFVPSQSFGSNPASEPMNHFDMAWQQSQALLSEPSSKTIAEQEDRDGEDVMAILSGSSALDSQMETPPQIEDDNYDWGLTLAQISQIREITKDILPPPESHRGVSADNSLNLLPDFQGQEGAREKYLEEWDGVLNRYADEVWGGLLPLIKEARAEAEELNGEVSNEERVNSKSTRRLYAILGHLGQR